MELGAIIHDQKDPHNKVSSMMHRFARRMPIPKRETISDFRVYAKALIERLFLPLETHEVCSFKEWIEHSHYTPSQRAYLTELRSRITSLDENMVGNDSFIKWEAYAEMGKIARSINSYSDESKAILGPLFHSLDKKTFKVKHFVKGTDPLERPKMMKDVFGDQGVMGTDFSSFEAHHSGVFAEITRHWVMHMMRGLNLPRHLSVMISRMFLGRNKCNMGDVVGEVDQRLMSGALWTSSANGVLNLCILSYLNARTMYPTTAPEALVERHDECFQGFVEGDDGICLDRTIPDELINHLGIVLKFDRYPNYGEASFCGIVCDNTVGVNLSDPVKFLGKFFVLPPKYATSRDSISLAYLRAKALSYKYALNDCPIIGPICHEVCRLTKTADPLRAVADVDLYKRDTLLKAIDRKVWRDAPNVRAESRELMSRVFGISPEQQIMIEQAFRCAIPGVPIPVELGHLVSNLRAQHARSHVVDVMPNLLPVPRRQHIETDDPVAKVIDDGFLRGELGVHAQRACKVYTHNIGSIIQMDVTCL